jgi:hypothetical protein
MAGELSILDYGPPARHARLKWLLRALLIILIIAAGAAAGAAIGHWVQPDRYIFDGTLAVSAAGADTDMAAAKQAHITAIRAGIPAATATLNAQGVRMSAAEFSNRITLKDVPQYGLISIRCTGREFNTPLAMTNALIVPYCNSVPGDKCMPTPGTLSPSVTYESAGFVLGGAATGLMILLRRRRLVRRGLLGWVV